MCDLRSGRSYTVYIDKCVIWGQSELYSVVKCVIWGQSELYSVVKCVIWGPGRSYTVLLNVWSEASRSYFKIAICIFIKTSSVSIHQWCVICVYTINNTIELPVYIVFVYRSIVDMHFVWFSMWDGFSLVSESHPRRQWLGWDSETSGEKSPSHMENHTKCIFSHTLHFKAR